MALYERRSKNGRHGTRVLGSSDHRRARSVKVCDVDVSTGHQILHSHYSAARINLRCHHWLGELRILLNWNGGVMRGAFVICFPFCRGGGFYPAPKGGWRAVAESAGWTAPPVLS